MSHKTYQRDDLQSEILEQIIKTYKLTDCPVCGETLEAFYHCHLGRAVSGRTSETQMTRFCISCAITWNLRLSNLRYQHRSYDEYHHALLLYGWWNCECRAAVIHCGTDEYLLHHILTLHRGDGAAILGEGKAFMRSSHRPHSKVQILY